MKRRFRQKQDLEPKDDPEKDKGLSDDNAQENVDIDDVIQEIDKQLETSQDSPRRRVIILFNYPERLPYKY
ncbi:MAG: hypothetical protein MZV63_27000 [Marinilabiliales bacterium]|nr:hypothetical protein [Marinilabiliales bacterium]